jgi:hypothetical protein
MQPIRLRPIRSFFSSNFQIADLGSAYVIYAPSWSTISFDPTELNGATEFEWYNPRTREFVFGGLVNGGTKVSFEAPDTCDWVLYIV